jgi:aspartate aminotransferase-like enzyme
MSNQILLLSPGPVQLHPEVQKILSLPMIHHRTPEFDGILKSTLDNLKYLFQTKNSVYMHTSTGSGGMESLLVNVLSPGDKVLVIVSGKFGERWADMAEAYGADVHRVHVTWGEAVSAHAVEQFLAAHPDTAIVMTQACETSTATMHDIQALGKIISKTKALFLVDGITALGAYQLPMDEWLIDGLVAGSQKAVMLPTGMSFVSFSEKAWSKIQTAKCPKFYFDIQKEAKANERGETLFSSNVSLVRALDYILKRIKDIGLIVHFSQLRRRADYTRSMAPELGLTLFSESPSDSVTALLLPSEIDGQKLRQHLESKYLLTVMGGQDQLKGKILRLGHMGYITDSNLHETTVRMAQGLIDFGLNLNLEKISKSSNNYLTQHGPIQT